MANATGDPWRGLRSWYVWNSPTPSLSSTTKYSPGSTRNPPMILLLLRLSRKRHERAPGVSVQPGSAVHSFPPLPHYPPALREQPGFTILRHIVLRYPYRSWECQVSVVTISSKWQVVIPKDVREKLSIKPGQKVQAFAVGDRIELVPVVPLDQLKGFLKGLLPDFEREPDRP
jgi:AbrB family looped-hinge helix DNA binding protein